MLTNNQEKFSYIPDVSNEFIPWGNFFDILRIVESNVFYPTWVTGLSGNGKTFSIEQACAVAGISKDYFVLTKSPSGEEYYDADRQSDIVKINKGTFGRKFVRVNFTMETGEDDLIGSYTLVNGNMVWNDGPVTAALREGAVLLLDEMDVGHTNRIMCLQSVLEGKGVLIKKTGEMVKPAPGFQIFATSNTKGRGSDDGRFIGVNMLNGAMIDRFGGMLHQAYPDVNTERAILLRSLIFKKYPDAEVQSKAMENDGRLMLENRYIMKLCFWAEQIRKSFDAGAATETITTRTLVNILQAYMIFEKYFPTPEEAETHAIKLACERYDTAVTESFVEMYKKMHSDTTTVKQKRTA